MALDEFHIGWGEEIEHHGGWDVPEGKLVVSPEIPVDGNLAYQVDPRLEVSSLESGDVVETGDDKPCRVDTQVTADEEMLGRRILHPGKPQADAAEKQKHIYSYIAHTAQSEESVLSRQCYMKENDEEHGGSHQFTAISADIRQFYIFYLHDFLLIFRVWNLLHQLGEEPCQADARYDVEEQANILKAVTLLERSHGVMELPRMCKEFCQWLEAKRQLALANADRVMDVYRRRSAVIGFRCGVIFHILEQTGEETDACIRFAKAVADYVLAMQMEMFGLRLDKQQQDNEAIPVYKSRNTLLFAQLPEQFTLFDASRERGDGASRETIRKMISRWTKRGLCKKLKGGDTEIWQKLTLSA